MHTRPYRLTAAGLALAAAAPRAGAQAPADTARGAAARDSARRDSERRDSERRDSAVTLRGVRVTAPRATLTVPTTDQATAAIQRTPGAVTVVADAQFKSGPASTIRDVLGWVPGVVTQTRWGPDARVSVRGSGLSRSYGNRGLNVYMDGVPVNTADGLFDLFEIDPTAYRYVEVYKGANALRYGANALGGAVVFVTPSGRDAPAFDARADGGSFGQSRVQASTGGVAGGAGGRVDYFVTGSAERQDGYRAHSRGDVQRLSGNVGVRLSPSAETRLYVNANSWDGRIPGEVSKAGALGDPRAANPFWVAQDQQRNINSVRVANKTSFRLGPAATLDVGAFGVGRRVDHPIFVYFDFTVRDAGGFARLTHEADLGGRRNRFVAGANVHGGAIDEQRYVNAGNATKGALISSVLDRSRNASAYAENSLSVLPDLAVVAGAQYLRATRTRSDKFLANGDQSGRNAFDLWTPKGGLLWDVTPTWQLFGNVSRSAEVPTFDVNTFTTPANSALRAQTATTLEVGTRGRRGGAAWDVALYQATVRNELQCLTNRAAVGACNVSNADRTTHRGVEAGVGLPLLRGALAADGRLRLDAAYTYNDFRFRRDAVYGDNRLPGVPTHLLRAELRYDGPRGLYVGPGVEWVPRAFFADNANTLAVDPYALLNVRAGVDVARRVSVYVEGRNLTDRAYISTAAIVGRADPAGELFNPGYGRAVYTGVRFTR